jgi:hypothetical protein
MPLQHHCYIIGTLKDGNPIHAIAALFARDVRNVSVTPCYTIVTPLLHYRHTIVTPFWHNCYTIITPLLHHCGSSIHAIAALFARDVRHIVTPL